MKCRDESHGWALNATEETRNGCQYFEHGESAGGGGVETVGSDQFASTQTFFFFLFSQPGEAAAGWMPADTLSAPSRAALAVRQMTGTRAFSSREG